jgi:hypothetical protein
MVRHSPSAPLGSAETIFDVLAHRAREHSRRFLAVQAGVTTAIAAVLFSLLPVSWPLGALLLAVGFYSMWGVLDSREQGTPQRTLQLAKRALVILATLACVATTVGTAFALFVGDSSSPYGVCYGADGRSFACDSRGQRR